MRSWLRLALRSDITSRGFRSALIVGTILTVMNYGDTLLDNTITSTVAIRIFLNFFVPYCVSTYASIIALRVRQGAPLS